MKNVKSVLILGFIIGFITSFIFLNYSYLIFQSKVESQIKKFYELVYPDSKVEVIDLKEESGLYKAILKITAPTGTSYQEAYITKDGKLLTTTDSAIMVESSIEQIEKSKNFVNCLFDENVRVYGVLNQTENLQGAQATLLQLNLLGRLYSPKLFVSCDGVFVQQCLDKGITQVPSVVVDSVVETGIKTIDWFENQTGCKLG